MSALRLRLAWHVLRGRPLVYRAFIREGEINLTQDTLVVDTPPRSVTRRDVRRQRAQRKKYGWRVTNPKPVPPHIVSGGRWGDR